MSKTEILPWYKLPGNPYITSISALMLLEDGYSLTKTLKLGKNQPAQSYKVLYDRQFIIELLINLFIEPLDGINNDELYELLDNAINYYEWCKTVEQPTFIKGKADFRNYCRHLWINLPDKKE